MRTEVQVDNEIAELATSFLQIRQAEQVELQSALKAQDFFKIGRIAHTLKGIASPYGFPGLGQLAKELELNAKLADATLTAATLEKMKAYLETCL
jgi:HPt (histidine-containing phosphotransfer) domain-containing protein